MSRMIGWVDRRIVELYNSSRRPSSTTLDKRGFPEVLHRYYEGTRVVHGRELFLNRGGIRVPKSPKTMLLFG